MYMDTTRANTSDQPTTESTPRLLTLADQLRLWIQDPRHILVQEFIIYEAKMSREAFEELCEKDSDLKDAFEYAMTVQEYKIQVGGLTGNLNPTVCIRLLETFHSWSKDTTTQVNVFQRAAAEAAERARAIDDKPRLTQEEPNGTPEESK